MKVGDLVRIASYCSYKGELAIITDVPPWKGEVYIRYLDPTKAPSDKRLAIISNLILVSKP